jgi:hypothetical protein
MITLQRQSEDRHSPTSIPLSLPLESVTKQPRDGELPAFIQRRVALFTDSKAISQQSAPLTKRYGSSGNSTGLADGFSLVWGRVSE